MEFTLTFIKLFIYGLGLAMPLLLMFILVIIVLGQIVGRRESWNRFDSLYWSFITATTVGYGDFRPVQKSSKLLSIMIAFVGLMFTGIIVALTIQAANTSFNQYHDVGNLKQNIQKEIK